MLLNKDSKNSIIYLTMISFNVNTLRKKNEKFK